MTSPRLPLIAPSYPWQRSSWHLCRAISTTTTGHTGHRGGCGRDRASPVRLSRTAHPPTHRHARAHDRGLSLTELVDLTVMEVSLP